MTRQITIYKEWSWARFTELGLEVTSLGAIAENFKLYEIVVHYLLNFDTASQWGLGDAYIAGTVAIKDADPTQAFPHRKGRIKTLQNYAWVCRRYRYSQRMIDISFSHHAIVAKLPHERRVYWLTRARDEDWTCEDLAEETRKERGIAELEDPGAYYSICERYNEMVEEYGRLPDYPEKAFIKRGLKAMEEGIQRAEAAYTRRKAA